MLRHVWIATHKIPHQNGHVESYICGVFPSGEVAEAFCLEWGRGVEYDVSRWDDGDIYIYEKDGGHGRSFIIQPHKVTYRPPVRERVHA